MYKKAWCTCKVVVLRNKPIAFLTSWLPSPTSLLKLPQRRRLTHSPFGLEKWLLISPLNTRIATRTSKKQWVEWAKQQLCTCSTLFCKFLCRHCTTTTWKCVISRFMEDVNKGRQSFFSLSEHGYSSQEFNSRRVRLHLTKQASWNKRVKKRKFTF